MKRKHIYEFLGIGVSAVILCAGCASEETESNPVEVQIREEILESKIDAADVPEHTSEPDAGFAAGTVVELTIEELNQFTEFVNQAENNGFLLSQYDTVSEVDLNEILYNGAGIGAQPLSESERKAYEAAGFTIETDITRLTVAQIEDFLQQKAGIGMEDMAGGLDWFYLEASDSYVSQHGDTNYCSFVCTGGQCSGDFYELRFKSGDDYVPDCVTVLQKNGNDYRFVSNHYFENTDDLDRIRKIEDQSFSVELESWGEVDFVSYGPDLREDIRQDVTFRLEQADGEAFVFPEVRDDNLRVNDRFLQIDAVAFQDYDRDGYTDIIIICTYEQTEGTGAWTQHPEVRIYKGGERTFRYMEKLCFALNTNGKNQSISQVLAQIEEEALDLSGLDGEIRRQLEVFAETKDQWVPQDYAPFSFGYTVYDLDGDGRLELLVQVMAGTGLFSENHFYQVNDAGNGIQELKQEYYDGFSQLDIGVSNIEAQAYRDGDGTVYYMAFDTTRNGIAESFLQDGAYYLKNGCIYSIVYRGLHRQAQGEESTGEEPTVENHWEETCYDAEGNEISREDWELLREDFCSGKTEIPYDIVWINEYPENVEKASVQEILRRLAECWQE